MTQLVTAAAALPTDLDSQHLKDGAQRSVISVPGDPMLPSSLSGYQAHTF